MLHAYRRLAALFLVALAALGTVLVLLPWTTLGRYESQLRRDYARQAEGLDFRLARDEPADRLWVENPALLGFRAPGPTGAATLRRAMKRTPPPDAAPDALAPGADPPVYVAGGAGGRRYYFDGMALAALATARRVLLLFGLAGLAGLLLGVAAFARRVAAPYREMSETLASAALPGGGATSDLQLVAGLRAVIAQLRAREAELERLGREARARAEHSEAIFTTLLSGADFPIGLYRRGGRIVQVSAPLRLLLRGADRVPGAIAARLDGALDAGAPLLHEAWAAGETGEPLAVSLLPIAPARGERTAGLLLIDREAAAARLHRRLAEQAHLARLGELGAVIAHETRNALGAIRGRLQLLARGGRTDPAAAEELLGEVDGLEAMVRAALDLARPESAQSEPVAPGAALAAAARRRELHAPRPRIEVALAPDLPRVLADPRLLERLLDNLVRNAAAAGPEGTLRLAAAPAGDGVELAVEDDGPGFPAAVLEGAGGAAAGGFGLPLCRKWAGLMGSELRLANRPGGGARAALVLPRAGENPPA